MFPAQDHFIVLTLLIMYIYIYMTFVLSLTQMLGFLSMYVGLILNIGPPSFYFGLCGLTFVLGLFGEYPGLCCSAPYVIVGSTHEL